MTVLGLRAREQPSLGRPGSQAWPGGWWAHPCQYGVWLQTLCLTPASDSSERKRVCGGGGGFSNPLLSTIPRPKFLPIYRQEEQGVVSGQTLLGNSPELGSWGFPGRPIALSGQGLRRKA